MVAENIGLVCVFMFFSNSFDVSLEKRSNCHCHPLKIGYGLVVSTVLLTIYYHIFIPYRPMFPAAKMWPPRSPKMAKLVNITPTKMVFSWFMIHITN
jgi:hypothetical protein